MTHMEKWSRDNKELHMSVEVEGGIQIVKIEAALFRLMLAEMGWMPLTDEAVPDSVVTITD